MKDNHNTVVDDTTHQPTVGFVSLGCPKALVDSERILTQLQAEGYQTSASYDNADVVIVNTCGFIDAAKEESLEAISEAIYENGKVIVTGCMGADADSIKQQFPEIVGVTGPQAYEQVMSTVHEAIAPPEHNPYIDLVPPQGVKLTPRHYAYLKISEGCNHRCTFCIIPDMRGRLVSRTADQVLAEATRLRDAGVKELLIVSQDTSAYGVDLKYKTSFWQGRPVKTELKALCEALSSLGIWVRLHYVYPYPNVDKLIPLMAEGHLLPYLDVPFQHASPRVLKAMKRPAASENNLTRIRAWRDICPELTIRSTFIVGFPGETDDDFNHLLDFLHEAQLDRVGCFKYSAVDGAQANALPDTVPESLAEERWHQFMQTQADISAQRLAKKIGSQQQLILDVELAPGQWQARSQADAPEIDGVVYLNVTDETRLQQGDFVMAKITDADDYDLFAVPVS